MIRVFRHYIPGSIVLLATLEALILFSALYFSSPVHRVLLGWEMAVSHSQLIFKSSIFMITLMTVMNAMGLYQREDWDHFSKITLRLAMAFMLGLFAMTMLYYFIAALYIGRGQFAIALVMGFVPILVMRYLFYRYADLESLKRQVLVLGAGARAQQIETLEQSNPADFRVVGYLTAPDVDIAVTPERLISSSHTLPDLTDELQVDELVVAVEDRRRDLPLEDVLECKMRGVVVTDIVDFFERETGYIQLESLSPSMVIFSDGFHQAVVTDYGKRLFDVLVSLLLLLLAWPIMLLTAIAIRLESGITEGGWSDPILYRQHRVGKGDRVFPVLKFRSMRVNAERPGEARWATKNDSRITRVGSFIRRTRIDELPQILNVLRGEMSFVGPRPERPQFVEQLSKNIPYYSLRHRVNPGITGWAQIRYPYGASEDDAAQKLQYDLYYIKNYSLFLDFMIILQTAHVILWGKGAR